jgi:hypothetical protein
VVDVGEGLANFWPLGGVGRSVVVYVSEKIRGIYFPVVKILGC